MWSFLQYKHNFFQSAYRQFHSTETALLKILGDVYTAVDGRKITIMVSLDLSAAFDTLNHSTMLHRLKHTFGISGSALLWISTYLEHRSFYVKVDDASSEVFSSDIGVPQGSVLGPLLFSLYVAPVSNIIESHGISYHQYADDTQLYIGCVFEDITSSLHLINICTAALNTWVSPKWIVPQSRQVWSDVPRHKLSSQRNKVNFFHIDSRQLPSRFHTT